MAAMRKKKTVKTPKGDQTRKLILDTALEMFRERGYEQTTMRSEMLTTTSARRNT
jgi:AcrR family transcriptional regulator